MDLERARWLASADGMSQLTSLPDSLIALPLAARVDALRRDFAPWQASALSEQLDLRARAAARFGDLPLALYTAPGIEMMTHPLVAARRAARLAAHGLPITDLTCGIGGDLSALAAAAPIVAGLDADPATVTLARVNVSSASVVIGDATRPPLRLTNMAVLLDPARRHGLRRRFEPSAFAPPWDRCLAIAAAARVGVLKGPPGLPEAAFPPAAEVEYVQLGRSMREAALYTGGDAVPGLRRAVLLPAGAILDSGAAEAPPMPVPVDAVIYDPASAVTLAGLVRHLGHRLGARLIDPHLGYLTASAPVATPFADAFEVLEVMPFSVARLRRRLRELGLRPHEIRRRAFPVEPDELRRLLGPFSGEPVTLLCCTVDGRRGVILARPFPLRTVAESERMSKCIGR